jgi:uncharacterized tellurite resistance protein B-like protein
MSIDRHGNGESNRTPPSNGAGRGAAPSSSDAGVRWFADATPAQKHAAVHALIAVATGDGMLKSSEKTAIAEACERLGVSSVEVAAALAQSMPTSVEPPHHPKARMQLMLDCAAVMVADHRIDDRELAVLLMVGKSLGFTPDHVADVAAKVTQALASSQRRQALIERVLDEMG